MNIKIIYILMQAAYWSIYCVIYGFSSVYLLGKDFDNTEIGFILSFSNIISILMQWVVSGFVLRRWRLNISSCMFFIVLLNIFFLFMQKISTEDFFYISLYSVITISLTLTLQPLINSLAFEYINNNIEVNFSLSRGIGSLSFSITSLLLGVMLNHYSSDVFVYVSLLLNFILLFSLISSRVNVVNINEGAIKTGSSIFSLYPFLFPFFIGVSLVFCFHTIITSYLAQIVLSFNGRSIDISVAFMIAGLSELPIMFFFSWLLRIKSSLTLVKLSSFFYLLRSVILLLAGSVLIIQVSQVLQAVSFALFIPASAYMINQYTHKSDNVYAQTYLNLAMTLGAVIGTFIGGFLFDIFNVTVILTFGSVVAGIGSVFIYVSLSKLQRRKIMQCS